MLRLQFIENYDSEFEPTGADGDAFTVLSAVISEQRVGRRIEPIFRVVIANPGVVGWMPSALRYAVLWEQRDTDPEPVLLARGRLVPLPTGMSGEKIELTFRCLPPNSDDVLTTAADALRVGEDVEYDPDDDPEDRLEAEYYDPLFVGNGASDDPENVLTARPEVWRWDRTTLALGRTHLVNSSVTHNVGYQGINEPPSLSVTHPPAPLSKLRVVANWTQTAKGKQAISTPSSVTTYTWEDFLSSFPQEGTAIGSNTGWTLAKSEVLEVTEDIPTWLFVSGAKFGGGSGGRVQLQPKTIIFRLVAGYDYTQQRQEVLDIVMPSGLQDLPDEDDQTEVIETCTLGPLNIDSSTPEWEYENPDNLEVVHYEVGDEVIANGKAWTCIVEHDATESFSVRDDFGDPVWEQRDKRAPLRDARNPRFLDLNRGMRAVRHAILRLHRAVLERSQCAETTFEVPWLVGRHITTEHSCRISHTRLPSGELTGKVTGIELTIEAGGKRSCRVTLASIPGTGAATPGIDEGQQQAGDVVYSTSYRAAKVPVNAFALSSQSPRVFAFENAASDQHMEANRSTDPVGVIGAMPTRLKIAFKALREEDLLTRRMSVMCLPPALPKQLNLRPDLGG
jgi:hypothetical protein